MNRQIDERQQPLTKGTQCRLIADDRKGVVLKASRYRVAGQFEDGEPFDWSRSGFYKDFKVYR
ncbi:MAG: hypothetical protein ABW168_05765 [Sedimenticola sp.]